MKLHKLLSSLLLTGSATLLAATSAIAQTVQVTGVQLKQTANGLQVILKTNNGNEAQSFTGRYGNTFFTDVINTRLKLPTGQSFSASNPTEDVASVTVQQLDANSIRIKVIGTDGIPTAQLTQSNQNLVFNLTPPSGTAVVPPRRTAPATRTPTAPTTPSTGTPTTPSTPSTRTPTTPSTGTPTTPSTGIPTIPSTETPTAPTTGTPTTPSTETPVTEPGTPPPAGTVPDASRPGGTSGSNEILPDRLIVTVTRTEEALEDVPRSVTVITSEQIQRQTALTRDLGETIAKLVPGFGPPNQQNRSNGQTLRGRNASILIDGVPQQNNNSTLVQFRNIAPDAIERIEVVRGPSATYGSQATGGTINIITRRPSEERLTSTTQFGVSAALGNLEEDSFGYNLQHSLSGTEGIFDYLLSVSGNWTGGFYDAQGDRIPTDNGTLDDTTTYGILGKVGLNFDENQRLQFTINHTRDRREVSYIPDTTIESIPGLQKPRAIFVGEQDYIGTDDPAQRGTVISLGYTNENLLGSNVQAQAYYRDNTEISIAFDYRDDGFFDAITQFPRRENTWGGRLQIDTPLFENASLLWGVDYEKQKNTASDVDVFDSEAFDNSGGRTLRKIGSLTPYTPAYDFESLGVFAQMQWDLSDRFRINGGVRHERSGLSIDNYTTYEGPENPGRDIEGGEKNFSATLFNIGAVYNLTDEVSLFTSFSQGFSVPNVSFALGFPPDGFAVEKDFQALEPQKVDNYEIGVRGNWNNVQASIAGFYNYSALGSVLSFTGNDFGDFELLRSPQRNYGVEATLDWQAGGGFALGGTVSWTEGDIDEEDTGDFRPLSNRDIQPIKITAYVEHQTTPGWRNRLQLLYSGDRRRGFEDGVGFRQPLSSYVVVDYISGIKLGQGELYVGIENLLNNQYFPVFSQSTTGDDDSSYLAARGRSISIGYRLTW
ncbi:MULTISPECIES: TonB-dependent receptor domain-containing protein [Cyanophyceae]|uniref:TonB-dependent receptor domain-containing protein n=1 Tax=Cyanophyceae TaxID=3028117 RepID=UPI001686AE50|nr:TonB-dependent receptor [Trichocoleus sp. FACHB-69]MBD1932807.1 TonB-dependent receptor [Trichocoleus sp. FACHB-69]